MTTHEPSPMKFNGEEVLPFSDEARRGLLAQMTNARRAGYPFSHEETIARLEATIRAREDDLREQNNRVAGEAIWLERYAEAETTFELCQELARRLRTYVIIGPRENAGPAITLTDHQVLDLVIWANEGDRKGGTTGFGAYFTAAMNVARAVRDLHKGKSVVTPTKPPIADPEPPPDDESLVKTGIPELDDALKDGIPASKLSSFEPAPPRASLELCTKCMYPLGADGCCILCKRKRGTKEEKEDKSEADTRPG